MKENRPSDLPKGIVTKLRAIRRRALGLSFLRGLCLSLAISIAAVLVAMLVDRSVGWFDTRPRYAFTLLALGAGLVSFVWWCLRHENKLRHHRSYSALGFRPGRGYNAGAIPLGPGLRTGGLYCGAGFQPA